MSRLFRFRKSKANLTLQNVVGSQEPAATAIPEDQSIPEHEKPLGLRSLLTFRVIVSAGNYATLSLLDIAYRGIQPLFLATPIAFGGLGLTPPIIGNILSCYGILNGFVQVFFFAKIHDKWGSRNTFLCGILSTFPIFAIFPLINYLARRSGEEGLGLAIWALVGLQVCLSVCVSFSYGAVFIYIAGASPNRASLGAVNGLAQVSVSLMRAVGPATANSLFSLSIKHNYLGGSMVYVVLMMITGGATICGLMLPKQVWKN